jgi:hypothetical protein
MVRSVEVIRKELKSLDETTATLAEEFNRLYGSYLEVLGQTIRRQVVIAVYHLCTQVYPEAFLALSVNQREQLQKKIRQLGRDGQSWLQKLMEAREPEPQNFEDLPVDQQERISRLTAALEAIPTDEEDSEAAPSLSEEYPETAEELPDSGTPSIQFIAVDSSDADTSELPSTPVEPEDNLEAEDEAEPEFPSDPESESEQALSKPEMDPKSLIQSVIMAAMAEDMQESLQGKPFTGDHLTPTLLAKHHLILEQRIRQVLHRLSKKANHHLKQAKVIPDLPEAVLDAAAEAETGPEKGRSMPNLLNVLVEMSSEMGEGADQEDTDQDEDEAFDQDSQDSQDSEDAIQGMMTHLAAINLRLSDLEFADVQASMWRSKLRTTLGKLRKLGKQYQRTQRELAIAEAEQAWRAVWYDDSSN